jgi:beta-galactosidase
MRRVLLAGFASFGLLTAAHADEGPQVQPVQVDASRPDWENPAVFARGKLAASATHFPFESRQAALAGDMTRSARYQSLDGPWAFSFSPSSDATPTGFEKPDYDVSAWKTIKVPAMWQTEGYDQPRYNNITYPFPANRPLIPHATNPVGSYRRTFEVPATWSGQDVILHIGAAGSAYQVWVNGQEAGYSEDSKLPSEFDVTRLLKPGQANIVAIQIHRWSDGSYLEDQDFWRVSGVERSVYLVAAPRSGASDVFVHAGLDKAYRDGVLSTDVALAARDKPVTVRLSLLDGDKTVLDERDQGRRRGGPDPDPVGQRPGRAPMDRRDAQPLHPAGRGAGRQGRCHPGHAAAHRLSHRRDQERPGGGQWQADRHPRRQSPRA